MAFGGIAFGQPCERPVAAPGRVTPANFPLIPAVARADVRRLQARRAAEQLLAQGSIPIGRLISAAALKFGNQEIGDVDEGFGPHREGEIEAVDVGFVDPILQLIGDRRRRADEHRPDATDGDMLGGLPDRSGSVGISAGDVFECGAARLARDVLDDLIRIEPGEIDPGPARQQR